MVKFKTTIYASLIFLLILTLTGCATKEPTYEKPQLTPLTFKDIEHYNPNITMDSKLKEAGPPTFLKMAKDSHGNIFVIPDTDKTTKPEFVGFVVSDLSKIEAMVDAKNAYRDITTAQGDVINAHIDTINALQKYVEIERQLTIGYYDLWQASQEAYRLERKEHRTDNLINKIQYFVTVIGGVAVVAAVM